MISLSASLRSALLPGAMALALAACDGASSSGATGSEAAASSPEAGAGASDGVGALAEMAVGDEDAAVTVIEYASLTCPHCATFHETIYPEIKEKYVDTGKVRFIFREFPTAPAELSIAASMLARCAADKGGQDAYFLVLGSLFKTQRAWITGDSPRAELIKVANQTGMDEAAFDACMKREELLDLINGNVNDARNRYDVRSTPSFIVNGDLRHFSTVEDFSGAIDEALEKAGAE